MPEGEGHKMIIDKKHTFVSIVPYGEAKRGLIIEAERGHESLMFPQSVFL